MADDTANALRIISLVMFLVISASLVVVGELLMRGRIRPNRYIGVRTPATMRNPDLWYVANAFAGKLQIWLGAVLAIIAIGLFFVQRVALDTYISVILLALVVLAVVCTVVAVIYLRAVSR
jgi:uncharacterized membrane protein